jgi:hypothetical protein
MKYLPAIGLVLLLVSCGDPKEFPSKPLAPFNRISSNGLVTFNLVTGARNEVLSTNLNEAMYNVSSGVLQVNGVGSMTIGIRNIYSLWCNACTIENRGPLVADTLAMTVHGGSVDFNDVRINNYLQLEALNTGTYSFSGTVPFFYVKNINLTSVRAFNLVTDSTYVVSSNVIDTDVHATQVVNVFINSMGNVNFKGNPPTVRLTRTGTGQLIKK